MPKAAVPEEMKVIVIDRFGPPNVFELRTVPVPKITATQVLIRVQVASVGTWDAKIRDGSWAEVDTFPQILGTDGCGVVAAVGSGVPRGRRGARGFGRPVPAGCVLP